jgi:hypothetical protein
MSEAVSSFLPVAADHEETTRFDARSLPLWADNPTAVDLLGFADIAEPGLDLLPCDRVLTETDFPHSQRSDPAAKRPAAVATIEDAFDGALGHGSSRTAMPALAQRRRPVRTLLAPGPVPAAAQEALLTAGIRE